MKPYLLLTGDSVVQVFQGVNHLEKSLTIFFFLHHKRGIPCGFSENFPEMAIELFAATTISATHQVKHGNYYRSHRLR